MRLFAVLVAGALTLASAGARADDDAMSAATADFDLAFKELSLTAPCDSMCKALQSMVRAADRICDLARDGSASDQKRCTDARQKVAEAAAKVRTACPACDPAPPYAPSTTAPTVKPLDDKSGDVAPGSKTPSPAPPLHDDAPAPTPGSVSAEYRTAGSADRRKTTVSIDVLPVFAPPFMIQPRLERSVTSWLAITLTGGYGSLPTSGPNGTGRTATIALGGELRAYVFGRFDGFGVFVAADMIHRTAALEFGETVSARSFPLGLTTSALVGTKLVTRAGFTLEARVGASYVADDRRFSGSPRLLPAAGVSAGWTF